MRWFVELRRTITSQIEVDAASPRDRDIIAMRARDRMDLGEPVPEGVTVVDTRQSAWELRSTHAIRTAQDTPTQLCVSCFGYLADPPGNLCASPQRHETRERRVVSSGPLNVADAPPKMLATITPTHYETEYSPRPLLGEADPELERLLQEEEEIDRAETKRKEDEESLAHVTSAMLQIVDHRDELKASQEENPQFSHNALQCPICILAGVVGEVVTFGRRFEEN